MAAAFRDSWIRAHRSFSQRYRDGNKSNVRRSPPPPPPSSQQPKPNPQPQQPRDTSKRTSYATDSCLHRPTRVVTINHFITIRRRFRSFALPRDDARDPFCRSRSLRRRGTRLTSVHPRPLPAGSPKLTHPHGTIVFFQKRFFPRRRSSVRPKRVRTHAIVVVPGASVALGWPPDAT